MLAKQVKNTREKETNMRLKPVFSIFSIFRKYIPVLKNYPINYIHEPWKAPDQVQKAAKCVVGVDYPKPMIDHELAGRQNQERMRQVYQQLSTYR